jgi:hypothetical protein
MFATELPPLSQIRVWDVEHLIKAADHWTGTADQWDGVALQVWQDSHGLDWEGVARDALIQRTSADKATISGKADQLRESATVARRGASDIDAARRRVMYAAQDAQNAGFGVGENVSVTDTRPLLDDTTLGTMAQRTLIDKDRRVPLPRHADPVAVAAAMNPVMSSWVALRHRIDFKRGSRVLILGATGNAGRMAIQVAKRFGAKQVVGAGRNPDQLTKLTSLGADRVLTLDQVDTKATFDVRTKTIPLADVETTWKQALDTDERIVFLP